MGSIRELDEYQDQALLTAVKGDRWIEDRSHYAFGVADEAGEVAGAMKKYLRGDFGEDELDERLIGELGDTLWYIAVLADHIGVNLSEVATANRRKLADRSERGKIEGDGDYR